jgi:hypothetical protein
MTIKATSPSRHIDIEALGFDAGAHLLVKHALAALPVGGVLGVRGASPAWAIQLADWCRSQGHGFEAPPMPGEARVTRGGMQSGRWRGAESTGAIDPGQPGAVADEARPTGAWPRAVPRWRRGTGLPLPAGAQGRGLERQRGRPVCPGGGRPVEPGRGHRLVAAGGPARTGRAGHRPGHDLHDRERERGPAGAGALSGQLHPHFREMQAALAMQVCDEARHIEVFTRRIRHGARRRPCPPPVGRPPSSLLDEPDFSVASFLLSVLGEGTFVNLLQFLQTQAPDR